MVQIRFRKIILGSLFLLSFSLLLVRCGPRKEADVLVATAANVQFAMDRLAEAFHEETGYTVESVLGSSGKLSAQIMHGAPYDLFVSADLQYPQHLSDKGMTRGRPRVYAFGSLVMWSLHDSIPLDSAGLHHPALQKVALANPELAPYGIAARSALIKWDVWEDLRGKMVFGESIAQTNQFVLSEAAQLGFTAKSVVMAKTNQGVGRWKEVPRDLYSPIAQGAVRLTHPGENEEASKAFFDFLFTPKAQQILRDYGYYLP